MNLFFVLAKKNIKKYLKLAAHMVLIVKRDALSSPPKFGLWV